MESGRQNNTKKKKKKKIYLLSQTSTAAKNVIISVYYVLISNSDPSENLNFFCFFFKVKQGSKGSKRSENKGQRNTTR